MSKAVRRIVTGVVIVGIVAVSVVVFRPQPVPVDIVEVLRAAMRVTVDEEGQTRIRERYVVSAPLAGRLRRIQLDPGDPVQADETVVAVIEPTDPSLLDARAQAGAEARVRAAEAAVLQAGANRERARSQLDLAESELTRLRDALSRKGAAPHEVDEAEHTNTMRMQEFRAAEFAEEIARFEVEQARSALMHATGAGDGDATLRFPIRSPITGRVLAVMQESVAVVTPGTSLLELGDPSDLELVVDVLSSDAVRIHPGAAIDIEHWGGDGTLAAVVRLVEPSAFTKVSALGVEEQRVNVIGDFESPLEDRPTLGDGYRIEARIVTWASERAVQVPTGALFRRGVDWAVFVVRGGIVEERTVGIGHRNARVAEVLEGLEAGDRVVEHPSDRVGDGVRVVERAG